MREVNERAKFEHFMVNTSNFDPLLLSLEYGNPFVLL